MQEHVGKKRRKELRTALEMKKNGRTILLRCFGILVVLIIFVTIFTVAQVMGIVDGTSVVNQALMLIIAFVGCIFVANESNKYWGQREQFKTYCANHEIMKDELKEFKAASE